MAIPSSNFENNGILKSTSDAPPTHYTVKTELFSMLTQVCKQDGYESSLFEAGGYKWKLVLYPNGNKKRNVADHISIYLVIVDTNLLSPGWEVYVDFRLFLLDQNKNIYTVFEDAFTRQKCFNGAVLDAAGFDKLIPIKDFNDASNGYIVNDTCVYGAEVFVCKERRTGKGERLRKICSVVVGKHVWKLDNFSKLDADSYSSEPFNAGGIQWKMQLYPKGCGSGKGTHLSLFFGLENPKTFQTGTQILADYALRILDQTHFKRHITYNGSNGRIFSVLKPMWGFHKVIDLNVFSQASMGYLLDDKCMFTAEVTVRGITTVV